MWVNFEDMKYMELKVPKPEKDQVLVKIQAAALNPCEWKFPMGMESPIEWKASYPLVLARDCAGIVVAKGSDVDNHLQIGDVVWANQGPYKQGCAADYAALKADLVAHAPSSLPIEEAAVIPTASLTAMDALRFGAAPWYGGNKTVVFLGGSGGVGHLGIQMAKAWGATQVITTCGTSHVAFCKSVGADVVIDYHKQQWHEVVEPRSVDLFIDLVGEKGTGDQAYEVIRENGFFVTLLPFSLPSRKAKASRPDIKHVFSNTDYWHYRDLEIIRELVDAGKLKPNIDKTYTFDELVPAFKYLMDGHTTGKISIVPPSSCGIFCTADSDCSRCGTSGKCSKASEKFPAIASSCVDAPPNPPKDPAPNTNNTVWPSQFTCDVETWAYNDWSDHLGIAKGKFYYDAIGGRSRSDWFPYTNGKNSTQIWLPSWDKSQKSKYYVKSGPLCMYFPIKDVDTVGVVNLIRPSWIRDVDKLGVVEYMGREKVKGEWTDHYAATYNTLDGKDQHNQTIVFATFTSIGLGKTPTGFPLRLTGGNINISPNGQPRLMSAWYSNPNMGPGAVKDDDFKAPGGICIPVAGEEAATFFGTAEVTSAQIGDRAFVKRAHFLPHARPALSDLKRARTKVPRADKTGQTFPEAMVQLNKVLVRDLELSSQHCEAFSVEQLHEIQKELFAARSPALQDLYSGHDNRALRYASHTDLFASHEDQLAAATQSHLGTMIRDGLCHELVMMYVHHLTESARSELKSGAFVLPRLPERDMHLPPEGQDSMAVGVHKEYVEQVTCTICHMGSSGPTTMSDEAIAV
jgi:NADPH:quinone reductase-like Zn-dependent oxidoreductase